MENINRKDYENQDTIHWAIVIFYKKEWDIDKYLVVQNKETGNISFVSWAKKIQDNNLMETAQREIKEELNINPERYNLIPTTVTQEFVFWPKKKERAWKKAIYHVFWANWSQLWLIVTTKELTSAVWMTKQDVLNTLTFDDVKDIFEKATKEISIRELI